MGRISSQEGREKIKVKAFTLLELCVCLAILVLAATVTGWKIKEFVDRYRFTLNVEKLAGEFRELQISALAHRSDFYLKIDRKNGRWTLQKLTDEPFVSKQFMQPIILGTIEKITLEGTSEKNAFSFFVHSSGRIEPQAILKIERKNQVVWLDLRSVLQIKISKQYPGEIIFEVPIYPEKKNENQQSKL